MGAPDGTGPQTVAGAGAGAAAGYVASLAGVANPSGTRVWYREAMWHEVATHSDWLANVLNWVDNARDLLYNDLAPLKAVMDGAVRAHAPPARHARAAALTADANTALAMRRHRGTRHPQAARCCAPTAFDCWRAACATGRRSPSPRGCRASAAKATTSRTR